MKTIIMGPAGKMGQAMVACADKHPNIELVGAIGPKGRDYIGKDIGLACHLGKLININVHDRLEGIIGQCDLVLDCTTAEASIKTLECCVKHHKALVCGTTGFNDEQVQASNKAGRSIPVVLATNTSRLFNLLFDIVRKVGSTMDRQADIDLVDMHDNMKLDAPSGTAMHIAGILSEALDVERKEYTYGRYGFGTRKKGSIAFNSIRSGGLPGSIKVIFGYENERMEISAHVYNMDTYAKGMIEAGVFLNEKDPGLYAMQHVFG